jgi:hypothetical protein
VSPRDRDPWRVVDEDAGGEDGGREGGIAPDLAPERAGPLAVVVWIACYLGLLYAFTPVLGTVEVPLPSGGAVLTVPLAPVVGLVPPFPAAGAVYGALTGGGGLRGGVRTTGKLFVDGLSILGEVLASAGGAALLGLSILYVLGWLASDPAAAYLPGNFLPLWLGSGAAVAVGGLLHWLHRPLARALGVEPRRA